LRFLMIFLLLNKQKKKVRHPLSENNSLGPRP
jgi:hypothetical protein